MVMVAEFWMIFIELPVKEDPENAAAGAARERAIKEVVFIFKGWESILCLE